MRIRPEIKRVSPAEAGSWYCTIGEAQTYLMVSRLRIRQLLAEGRLGEPAQCWGRLLIPKECVERFDRGRVAATR